MSKQISQEYFLNKVHQIYPNSQLKIIEWNGYTKSLTFQCDLCKEIHIISDARQVLNKKNYCQKDAKNNQKWDIDSYNQRINLMHNEHIKIIEYNGLSNPVKYLCPKCEEEKTCNPARTLITKQSLCNKCYGVEKNIIYNKIMDFFDTTSDYKLITWHGTQKKMKIKCLKCGNIFDRLPNNVIRSFDSCPYCNNGATKQKLSIEEEQQRIDNEFGEHNYLLIDYQGQLSKKSKVKCLNCGLIFNIQCSSFIATRGCPKCKRYKSKGEQLVQKYLDENNIKYETQKRFHDCNNNLSSFDFCVYDCNNNIHLIEVNGRQHYFQTERFGDLMTIQARDKIKIDYCKKNNLDLIIIPYSKLSNNGVDKILNFLKGSTTIPEGSKE